MRCEGVNVFFCCQKVRRYQKGEVAISCCFLAAWAALNWAGGWERVGSVHVSFCLRATLLSYRYPMNSITYVYKYFLMRLVFFKRLKVVVDTARQSFAGLPCIL